MESYMECMKRDAPEPCEYISFETMSFSDCIAYFTSIGADKSLARFLASEMKDSPEG
ncbi:hypothetical protein LCGC14_1227790 [marine sediment metagenome]|uniref:Uncharacterized protein n=1 Tax=marine sediment metagenome TaxID=412755 RepID=A0A0F9LDH0_9ZZZZ